MARWGARSPFDIGEAVAVLYDPSHPRDARIDSFFQLWFAPLILGFLGSCSPRSVAAPSLPLCARPTDRGCRGRRLLWMSSIRRLRDSRRMTLEPVMVHSNASHCRRRRSRESFEAVGTLALPLFRGSSEGRRTLDFQTETLPS